MDLGTETNWTNNTKSVISVLLIILTILYHSFLFKSSFFSHCTTSIGSAVCEIIPLSSVKFGGIQDIKDKNHEIQLTKNNI